MSYPIIEELDCPPVGIRPVAFDLMDEDDDFYVTEDLGDLATNRIVSHWNQIWDSALPMLDQLLEDYKQGATACDLLRDESNTLNVLVMLPDDDYEIDHKFCFDLFIDKKTDRGSIVFGVEFADIEAQSASATF